MSVRVFGTAISVALLLALAACTHTALSSNQGQLSASTVALNLGNVNIGTSSSQAVTLSNSGATNVAIFDVSILGAGINTSGIGAGLSLTPGQTATLNVTFAPASSGRVWQDHGHQQRREFANVDCCVGYRRSAGLALTGFDMGF